MKRHIVLPAKTQAPHPGKERMTPLLLVSGPFGSGMEELAEELAACLQLPFYDPHRLEQLASDRQHHQRAWRDLKMAEGNFFDYWLGQLHAQPRLSNEEHLTRISLAIREIATQGGIVAGICPHIVQSGKQLFRIQVKANARFCARRLAILHSIDEAEAMLVFLQLESERRLFLLEMFEENLLESVHFDLILEAELLTAEQMITTCLHTLEQKGLLYPDRGQQMQQGKLPWVGKASTQTKKKNIAPQQ
ncbi:MAG: cytidylate kinase family protein [Magnetococcales bacterium]|nr:cytidylate kinase family protein [Magnetococcales bacterium]